MSPKNANGRLNPQPREELPKAYRQGQLDALCGLYSIINACRMMCRSPEINKRVSGWELFNFMVEALDKRRKAAEVMCYGIGRKDHLKCLKVARKYLLGKHGLLLEYKRPFRNVTAPTISQAFTKVGQHLELPGTGALLDFKTASYQHWSVICSVKKREVQFYDSTGISSRPYADFQILRQSNDKLKRKMGFFKSGLITMQVTKLE